MFPVESKDRKRPVSQIEGNQAEGVLSYPKEFKTFLLFMLSSDWMRAAHMPSNLHS